MTDKDLLVVISEMLQKQDRQTAILEVHSKSLMNINNRLENLEKGMEKINDTLKDFVDISVKQFEEQQKFNRAFFLELKHVNGRLDNIEGKL